MRVSFTKEQLPFQVKGFPMKQDMIVGRREYQGGSHLELSVGHVNKGDAGIWFSSNDKYWSVISYNTQGADDTHQITIVTARRSARHFIEFTRNDAGSWGYETGVASEVSELGKVTKRMMTSSGMVTYNGARLDELYRHLVIGKRQ